MMYKKSNTIICFVSVPLSTEFLQIFFKQMFAKQVLLFYILHCKTWYEMLHLQLK